jgi:N-ethylmaleimide reductase
VPIGVGTPRRLTASTPRAQRTGFAKAWATSSRSAANLSQTLPVRLRIGAPLNVDDPTTYYGGGEKGYTGYSSLEQDRGNKPKARVDQR